MFHSHRLKAVVYLNHLSSTPKSHHLLHSLNPFSTTSDSFTLSYFTNNCGLSPQDALKASKRLRLTFTTPEKPNSVIAFFKTHGFSIPQIQSIILKNPQLILSNPTKTILPKFQFLASKGASPSDIVAAVTRSSRFLRVSLEKHIIPAFQLVALATAAKAKLLLRELKTVKADLAFAKARCAQLEEENKLLREREGSDKGLIRDDDDLIRHQMETLLAEKSRLANENETYSRENRFLREIVEYHQLTMQDVVQLDKGMEDVAELYPMPVNGITRLLSGSPLSLSPTPTSPDEVSLGSTKVMFPMPEGDDDD